MNKSKITKVGDSYYRTFEEKNISLAKYENGIIKSENWDFLIEFTSDDMVSLETLNVQGLSINDWIRSLFDQKFLVLEETEYTSHFSNTLQIQRFDTGYVLQIVEMILKPNLPDSILIVRTEINVH